MACSTFKNCNFKIRFNGLVVLLVIHSSMGLQSLADAWDGNIPGEQLDENYYDNLCNDDFDTEGFQQTTADVVDRFVSADPTLPPSLLRMAFHDSFVRGCDGSVLINSTANNVAEKDGIPNANSLRGFNVIDAVKAKLESKCPGIFSCADIVQEVALAAMQVNQANGSPHWQLRYGRRDGKVSLAAETLTNLPSPAANYSTLVKFFAAKNLSRKDLVVLSGAHTFGRAHCIIILRRLYNFTGKNDMDPALDPTYGNYLKQQCTPSASPSLTVKMDPTTPDVFDNAYFGNVLAKKGFFVSDSALNADPTNLKDENDQNIAFLGDFQNSMTKLSEVQPLLYPNGEIRRNCAVIN